MEGEIIGMQLIRKTGRVRGGVGVVTSTVKDGTGGPKVQMHTSRLGGGRVIAWMGPHKLKWQGGCASLW